MTVARKLRQAIGDFWDVAPNPFLDGTLPALERIETASQTDEVVATMLRNIEKVLTRPQFNVNCTAVNEFLQRLGEAQFFLAAQERGVLLERIEESTTPTPDFKTAEAPVIYFEVKTLSVVDGDLGIHRGVESALEAHLDMEQQRQAGRRIVIGLTEARPFGGMEFSHGGVTRVLVNKARQNLKRPQFSLGPTYLVLNIQTLDPGVPDLSQNLRAAYVSDRLYPKPVSGRLWMAGFGNADQLPHGEPEFEGKPALEQPLGVGGILNDFAFVHGILFMSGPWSERPKIGGLFRSGTVDGWNQEPAWCKAPMALVGENWNDEHDSRAFALKSSA